MSAHQYPQRTPRSVRGENIEIRFLGRNAPTDRLAALRQERRSPRDLSLLHQVHSSRILHGISGLAGDGDGLWTSSHGLALSVATADCVPIVIASAGRLAVVHAGWRGIASRIVLGALQVFPRSATPSAWIGPSIRGCCYEVSNDVAEAVMAVSDESSMRPGSGDRPHVDLVTAVGVQLRACGVGVIHDLSSCTYCHSRSYWSFRRLGSEAERNYTFAWLSADGEASA